MKQYVVIGLGTFGFNIAVELTKQGNQVLAIDSDKEVVDDIKNLVTEAIHADTTEKEALVEFIDDAFDTAILGLGERYMEATVLAIIHLKNLGIKNIIVKSINDLHGEVYRLVGANEIINPEKETALRLARRLTIPTLIDQIPLAPDYSIVEIALPDEFVGRSIRELNLRQKYDVAVIAIKNILLDEMLLIPNPDYKFIPDTALIVLGKHDNIDKLRQFV